jgi:hypothetical protein
MIGDFIVMYLLLQQACPQVLLVQHSEQALLVDYESRQLLQHRWFLLQFFYSSSNGDFNIIHFQFNLQHLNLLQI